MTFKSPSSSLSIRFSSIRRKRTRRFAKQVNLCVSPALRFRGFSKNARLGTSARQAGSAALLEKICNVHDADAINARLFEAGAHLQNATWIGRDYHLRAGIKNVFGFPPLKSLGHFGFS